MPWDQLLGWLDDHRVLLVWLTVASGALFLASLIIVPIMVVRIPTDYFAHQHRPRSRFRDRHPIERVLLAIAKNSLAVLFLLVGTAMLVLPGQGLLTMFIGFMMLDFPGKYRFERWLVARRFVSKPINWLRRRRDRPPLAMRIPGDTDHVPPPA